MRRDQVEVDWGELIRAARTGDDRALCELWLQVRSYLLMFANQRMDVGLKQKLDASDIVQQSFLEAHRAFEAFRGNSEAELRAWLSRLVKNNIVDASRRYRCAERRSISKEVGWDVSSEVEAARHQLSASSIVRRRETDEELLVAISSLPQRSQQVIQLRHRYGLSHAQVASELGMTETAARKLWTRIIKELQKRLTSPHAEYSAIERSDSQG